MDLIKKNKVENAKYTYYSLYMDNYPHFNNFTIHINVVIDNCFSPTTFTFCMVWKDKSFSEITSMDNVSTYIGTPAYWFGRNEATNINMGIKDEIKIEL